MLIRGKQLEPLLDWRLWAPPAAVALLLVLVARHSYLAFHTFAELFTIFISFLIFAFAWSVREFYRNNFLLFLACGYFWIGALDLMHALSFEGMDVFAEGSPGLTVQFWIGTRYCEALLLLVAPLAITRRLNGYLLITAFGAVAIGLTTTILWGRFPVGFVEGEGLTDFKIYSEYLIDLILALALVVLFRRGQGVAINEKALIAAAIVLTMCAELAFTFYINMFGLSNLAGHIFKLFSFWLIFQAIVISHLKEPYTALQESEGQSRSLFENAEVSIWNEDLSEVLKALDALRQDGVTDLRGYLEANEQAAWDIAAMIKVLEVNRATLKLFGSGEDRDFFHGIDMAFGPKAIEVFIDELCAIWDKKKVFRSEAAFQTRSGKSVHGIISFQIPETEDGFRSIPVSIIDISDRKQAEELLLEAKEDAEAANRAKSEFLGSMSHELRTPLNAILGFAQILQASSRNPLSGDQSQQVEYILGGGNHLLKLINQVLDLARIEADEVDLSLEDVNANEVLADCVALVTPLGEERGVRIINRFSNGPPVYLRADQLRLKQVLINLLSNAIKYNTEGGTVSVEGRETRLNFLRISVTDTGIGIAEKDHASVFRMFHRLRADPAQASEGAGIGLSVTKALVEKMDGRIGFESKEGVGSTFWIELPLVSNDIEQDIARLG